ncbi:hypothetical protein [Halanaeroarchaeum sulfurireducens]|uniref:hypothetical protein n=1 Tax=Halanaeroarchaeum sulfurireducens TaxID=1604004 RepID=UPI0012B62636|nr:hypothetical protein [Halanaeroarchaeum sulfurireducens]
MGYGPGADHSVETPPSVEKYRQVTDPVRQVDTAGAAVGRQTVSLGTVDQRSQPPL